MAVSPVSLDQSVAGPGHGSEKSTDGRENNTSGNRRWITAFSSAVRQRNIQARRMNGTTDGRRFAAHVGGDMIILASLDQLL
ncbi:unnamed protein product [Macrosiphum euphorbiae]|uniref:Uncharacterized protein n=1 Tax=Macrosiphum euphorbiae TaxID=13131 RepID=A0AAV0XI80_9HEMI|nr:unnamed protein product [Macrosiphum euphorbiae]